VSIAVQLELEILIIVDNSFQIGSDM